MSATFGPRTTSYESRAERVAARSLVERAEAALVLAFMGLLSLAMWIAVPFLWLHLAASLGNETPAVLHVAIAIGGLTASVAALAKVLFLLNCRHCELVGRPLKRMPRAYLQSYAERRAPCPTTALDTIQVVCAGGSVVAFLVWYVAFDGRSVFA